MPSTIAADAFLWIASFCVILVTVLWAVAGVFAIVAAREALSFVRAVRRNTERARRWVRLFTIFRRKRGY